MGKYYMAVTKDEYELPIAIASTTKELANKMGISNDAVRTGLSKHRKGFATVDFDELEEMQIAVIVKWRKILAEIESLKGNSSQFNCGVEMAKKVIIDNLFM